ncbi:hypothetical protein KIN20_030641 [Parelaphostrongylus tenuis]|uniref:Lipoprotein n=1 Tax=Parelaphostrongylus tenuis TaxID=148309 RepID=A0AAD5WG96_PARTN|nr:hypothetical protein KIN20_030641 [Parelaphostrongylus tenuis]
MKIPISPASLLTGLFVTTLLATISTVLGCGVIPADQGSEQDIVFNVLERQGRSALLPDTVISLILGQLSVQLRQWNQDKDNCIIVGNTVTGICNGKADQTCTTTGRMVMMKHIPDTHSTISGTLSV